MTDPDATGTPTTASTGPGATERRDPTADLVRMGGVHALAVFVPVSVLLALIDPVVGVLVGVLVSVAVTVLRCRGIDERTARALGAIPVDGTGEARLASLADNVSMAVGVPPPRLYRIDDDALNAVVWGSGTGATSVAVTSGLLGASDRIALEAVVARLLVDVRDGVVEGPTVAASLFGAVARGPLAAAVAALSRTVIDERRVALGDVQAANAIQYPPGMVAVVDLLQRGGGRSASAVTRSPRGLEALWLASPTAVGDDLDPFDVHPPLADRADVLREL